MQRVHPKDNPDIVSEQHQEIVIHHCKICSKKFIDEKDLLSHVAAKHKTRPCPTCGTKFWSKEELKRHNKKMHANTAAINDLQPEKITAPIKNLETERNDSATKSLDLERTTKRPLCAELSNSKESSKKMKRSSSGTGGSNRVNLEDDSDKSNESAKPSTSKIDTGGAYPCNLCDQTFTQICNMVNISKISKLKFSSMKGCR